MDPSQLDLDSKNDGAESYALEEYWPEESNELLYKGNLIYLPFARHLAEEDEEAWAKAA